MSKYTNHVAKWTDCQRCHLKDCRKRVVHYKGSIPCDVLIIGESPGNSEDVIGRPFVGPAGKLLDRIIDVAKVGMETRFTMGFTNLVGCIPKEDGKKTHTPDKLAILACSPRLVELYDMAKPRLTILVGGVAEKNVPGIVELGRFEVITHPSAILQADITQRGLMIQRNIVILSDAFQEL